MKSNIPIPVNYLKNPVHFLALGFGSGLMPKAPGTFGTLAAIPIYYLCKDLSLLHYLLFIAFVSIAGIYICQYTSDALKVHDHPGIVIDEFAGYFITMIAIPFSWQSVLAGFVVFRIFDIFKPWPISFLDKKVHGGLGIMIDDVVAGLFALLIMHLFLYFNVI